MKIQAQVMIALILRDIHSRFGSAPAFLVAIAWPLSHIMLLVMINSSAGRMAPFGNSSALWIATGVVPFMVFSYTARFVMMGVAANRQLLMFPNVKILDMLFSRAITELLISAAVIFCLAIIFTVNEIDFEPINVKQAVYAILTSFWLGLGIGIINAMIIMIFHQWGTVFNLTLVFLWLTSGILFVPSNLPAYIRDLIYLNPTVHCSEWLRSAYYDGYDSLILDKQFVLIYATAWVFLGLVIERAVRGKMLAG